MFTHSKVQETGRGSLHTSADTLKGTKDWKRLISHQCLHTQRYKRLEEAHCTPVHTHSKVQKTGRGSFHTSVYTLKGTRDWKRLISHQCTHTQRYKRLEEAHFTPVRTHSKVQKTGRLEEAHFTPVFTQRYKRLTDSTRLASPHSCRLLQNQNLARFTLAISYLRGKSVTLISKTPFS